MNKQIHNKHENNPTSISQQTQTKIKTFLYNSSRSISILRLLIKHFIQYDSWLLL